MLKMLLNTKKKQKLTDREIFIYPRRGIIKADQCLHVRISEHFKGDHAGWIHYMLKTYEYDVKSMTEAKHAVGWGYRNWKVGQQIIDDYKKKEQQRPKQQGPFAQMKMLLDVLSSESELDNAQDKIFIRLPGAAATNINGVKALIAAHRKRIKRAKVRDRSKNQTKLRLLKMNWTTADFNYGDAIKNDKDEDWFPDAYNNIANWIKDLLFDKIQTKESTLFLKVPNYNQGKSTFIEILLTKFKGYEI